VHSLEFKKMKVLQTYNYDRCILHITQISLYFMRIPYGVQCNIINLIFIKR